MGSAMKEKKKKCTTIKHKARGRKMTEAATVTIRGEMMMREMMRTMARGSAGDRRQNRIIILSFIK